MGCGLTKQAHLDFITDENRESRFPPKNQYLPKIEIIEETPNFKNIQQKEHKDDINSHENKQTEVRGSLATLKAHLALQGSLNKKGPNGQRKSLAYS